MKGIFMQSDSEEDLKLLIALAKKLGVKAESLTEEDLEATGLAKAIEEGKTGQHIDTQSFLQSLEDGSKD
jgi:hypothetical protein